jgi:hypothetical protein
VGDSGATATYSNVDLISGVTLLSGQNGWTIDAAASGKGDLGSKTTIYVNGVEEKIHTSCSTPFVAGAPAPLDNPKGDPSPNWYVISFEDKNGGTASIGADVKYTYKVSNVGPVEATEVTVNDSVLGEVPGSPIASILPSEMVTLMQTVFVYETTTSKATVSGSGGGCTANDKVEVRVDSEPTPTPTE